MSSELIEVIDLKGNVLEILDRSTAYDQGKIHKSIHIIAFNNSLDKIYVQKRSHTKLTWPGTYDLSVAETNKPGESYMDSAKRGLKEELNVTDDISLVVVRDKYYQEFFYSPYKLNVVVTLFTAKLLKDPRIDEDEVEGIELFTFEEIDKLINSHPEQCTPWFVNDWKFIRSNIQELVNKLKSA